MALIAPDGIGMWGHVVIYGSGPNSFGNASNAENPLDLPECHINFIGHKSGMGTHKRV